MTDKDIETIITTAIHNSESVAVDWTGIRDEASGEIEDLEALLAYIAAMREIVQAVAHTGYDAYGNKAESGPYTFKCPYCFRNIGAPDGIGGGVVRHTDTCLVTKARALLSAE